MIHVHVLHNSSSFEAWKLSNIGQNYFRDFANPIQKLDMNMYFNEIPWDFLFEIWPLKLKQLNKLDLLTRSTFFFNNRDLSAMFLLLSLKYMR